MPKRRGFSELRRPDWSFKGRMPKFGSTMSRGSLALCVMHRSPSRWPNWNSVGTCLGFLAYMLPRRMARSPNSAALDAVIGSGDPVRAGRPGRETSRQRSSIEIGPIAERVRAVAQNRQRALMSSAPHSAETSFAAWRKVSDLPQTAVSGSGYLYLGVSKFLICVASASTAKGLVRICIPWARCPFPITAFSA